jgi:hypothetical protein
MTQILSLHLKKLRLREKTWNVSRFAAGFCQSLSKVLAVQMCIRYDLIPQTSVGDSGNLTLNTLKITEFLGA